MDIGKRMKDLRMLYGLTQQELADRAELTKGFISQLERNQNSPSVGTLLDIIQCLGTTPAEFFSDAAPEQVVFAANDYFEKADSETHSKIEWIVPNAQKNTMEPVRLTLESKGTSPIYQPQDTENFGYVLKGSVRLHLGGKSHTVKSGESFYFKGNSEHFIENPGERTAVLIWVKNPPFF
ncbi:MAG: cupin domain-containing protein [Lachnospiraceae bacterium]|nr:cupin domain-containing protein [Lachnospiraceae bacterium]